MLANMQILHEFEHINLLSCAVLCRLGLSSPFEHMASIIDCFGAVCFYQQSSTSYLSAELSLVQVYYECLLRKYVTYIVYNFSISPFIYLATPDIV